ncbi:MAG: hypothetical protein Q8P16_00170, partial [bacterium]|nr:hypothetical protein [bacterium]
DWGDGTSLQRYEAPQTTDCGSDVVEKTFAHTYVRTGTYTIRTKVGPAPLAELPTNEDTIVVRAPAPTPTPVPEPEPEPENTCPYPAGEVCGEVVSQCPFGYTCAQDLRTYADRCKMEDAGAVFYSTGACQ